MANPLIIFGAGASYDYSPFGRVAPLTNQLTDVGFLPDDLLEKYQGASALLSDIVLQVKNNNKNFEEVLTEMKERTKNSTPMRAQFSALEFYLKALFERISNPTSNPSKRKAYEINNYKAIMNRVDTHTGGRATIATFNYDTLFENSLSSKTPAQINDYVSGDLKIIKLHGSHDWVYIHRLSDLNFERLGVKDNYELCIKNPDFLDGFRDNQDISPMHIGEFNTGDVAREFAWFPAIAIPLVGKGTYVCPKKHIQVFEKELPSIDRVLVIGWRAGDPLLLETLKKHLPRMGYKILVVSNELAGAEKIADTIKTNLGTGEGVVSARGGGFSGFVSDEVSHTFFTD